MFWCPPIGSPQTGTLNAFGPFFHHDPVAWLQDQWPNGLAVLNNLALIGAATWGITGFAMVILSAALKGIPGELLEAARVHGAGEITVFRRVIFPLTMPPIDTVRTPPALLTSTPFAPVFPLTSRT